MKIVIIEDEKLAATDLADTIKQVVPDAEVCVFLHSVKSAIEWFRSNDRYDLVFSDIQLGDGQCFEIYKSVDIKVPIIFCTAFDEFALKAFKTNGIDYILKPFDKASIAAAFEKYYALKESLSGQMVKIDQIMNLFERRSNAAHNSVLVFRQDKILPLRFRDIALFYIDNEVTHLQTFTKEQFTINKTIENLEEMAPEFFFRINRQYLVNREAIKEASQYFARKLSLTLTIPFHETVTVSKNRVSDFLNWLTRF